MKELLCKAASSAPLSLKKLTKLVYLNLKGNSLKPLPGNYFSEFNDLIELDVSDNKGFEFCGRRELPESLYRYDFTSHGLPGFCLDDSDSDEGLF